MFGLSTLRHNSARSDNRSFMQIYIPNDNRIGVEHTLILKNGILAVFLTKSNILVNYAIIANKHTVTDDDANWMRKTNVAANFCSWRNLTLILIKNLPPIMMSKMSAPRFNSVLISFEQNCKSTERIDSLS